MSLPKSNRPTLAIGVLPLALALSLPLTSLLGLCTPSCAQSITVNAYSLKDTLVQVETSNRAVQNARLLVDAASADIRRADIGLNPSLSAGAFNSAAGRYRPKELDQTVRIEQTFERGNKRALRVATAQELQSATILDVAETIRLQKVLAATNYVELTLAQRLKRLVEENEANFKRLVEGAQRRLKAGDIAQADVSRLRVEASRASNEVRTAEANLLQAQLKLAVVLAQEGTTLSATDTLPDTKTIVQLEDLFKDASHAARITSTLANRSDLQAARARVKAQEKALLLAKSLQIRDITIGAQTERAPSYGGRVFGLSAAIPLLVNNDYYGDILRASAELSLAQAEEERLTAQIRNELQANYVQLLASKDRLNSLLGTTLPEVVIAAQAIEYAYTRGAATLTDLFDARRQFNAVQMESAMAQGEFAKAIYAYQATTNIAIQ
jgi:outer membrane protein, heavy metal efflux system